MKSTCCDADIIFIGADIPYFACDKCSAKIIDEDFTVQEQGENNG